MLRWCDAVNKYNFELQHGPGAKHQNAEALSRVLLKRCSWEGCVDCREGLEPFADEDECILTRHNKELIIGAPVAVAASSK